MAYGRHPTPPTRRKGRRHQTGLPVGKYTHVVAVEHRNDQICNFGINLLLRRIARKDLVVLEGLLLLRTSHFYRKPVLGELHALPAPFVAAVLELSPRYRTHPTVHSNISSQLLDQVV